MRSPVDLAVVHTGLDHRERCFLRFEDEHVDAALRIGESTVDRQCARDICGVVRVRLDTGVNENQVAVANRTIILDPMQHARVGTGGDNRVVSGFIAFQAGSAIER